ncbi:MAG TPA: DciA family protein [Streptosporangiaceae bacterium]
MADDNAAGQDEAQRRLTSAREALADAISDARARGASPALPRTGKGINSHTERLNNAGPSRRRSASGEDPTPLGAAIKRLLNERGWQQQAAVGSALGRWAEIVGPELAAHAKPDGLTDGELVVIADSTAWATQLRLLAATLVKRLNAELGDGTVRRVKVRGPAGPPRQPGAWRAPGGRGPRDTYG